VHNFRKIFFKYHQ